MATPIGKLPPDSDGEDLVTIKFEPLEERSAGQQLDQLTGVLDRIRQRRQERQSDAS